MNIPDEFLNQIKRNAESIFPTFGPTMQFRNSSSGPVAYEKDGYSGGLTKRELFAGMAMQGIASSTSSLGGSGHLFHEHESSVAKVAVEYADALITELEKEKKK
jgi:hypothetical protein